MREVEDLPLGVRRVKLHLQMNRYRCNQPTCPQQTFREQHPGWWLNGGAVRTDLPPSNSNSGGNEAAKRERG